MVASDAVEHAEDEEPNASGDEDGIEHENLRVNQ